ncbi:hypothetical protein [Phenylobacterium sp.]|uniref:hypothetical protein n=1 Tax=Phenylobacterium sp. TaxID=1871053 RepID=UPI00286A44C1|nr:hypothetical protein [Phenylobacterium sp.]
MTKFKPLIVACALSLPLASNAWSQAPSATALEGKAVVGQGGELLGHVERVVLAADGSPAQVLVRPKGVRAAGPRSLPVKVLKAQGEALAAPLTKAEFDSMPAVETARD